MTCRNITAWLLSHCSDFHPLRAPYLLAAMPVTSDLQLSLDDGQALLGSHL